MYLKINLTPQQVDNSLAKINVGLEKYTAIQNQFQALTGQPLKDNIAFRKSFNGYYRIQRRPAAWYNSFYELLDESRYQPIITFPSIFRSLHNATNRYEASFASKLLATLNPDMPVIDSVVLGNLNTKLPNYGARNRFEIVCSLHSEISRCYGAFLHTNQGRDLVNKFQKAYPTSAITEVKMLDLILWQSR